MVEVNFWHPLKTVSSCEYFIIIIIIIIKMIFINFFRRLFSEYTEANMLHLLYHYYTIFPEKCAFIIGFSCTMWTKMRPLAGSVADGVLADAI